MTKKKLLILICSAASALIIAVMVFSAMAKPPATAPSPVESSTVAATQQEPVPDASSGSAPVPTVEALNQVQTATAFIQAYTSASFEDERPNSWVDRAIPFASKEYASQLRASFGDRGGAEWEEFQTQQLRRQAIHIKVTPFPEDPRLFMVEYEDQTLENSSPVRSTQAVKVLSLQRAGQGWAVTGLSELGDQPMGGGPVAPSDMGPEMEAQLDQEHQD